MENAWIPLSGVVLYGDNYEVSSKGEIRNSITGKILKPFRKGNGYMSIGLTLEKRRRTYYVHRLVALAFMPNNGERLEVNHKDGVKDSNAVSNLEWVTSKENKKHAVDNKLMNSQIGSGNYSSVLDESKVREIKELYSSGTIKQKEIAKMFQVTKHTICCIVHNITWSHVTIDSPIYVHSGKQGESNSQSKLTNEDVEKIRKLYSKGKHTYKSLGERFKVSGSVIGNVVRYKTWKHVI